MQGAFARFLLSLSEFLLDQLHRQLQDFHGMCVECIFFNRVVEVALTEVVHGFSVEQEAMSRFKKRANVLPNGLNRFYLHVRIGLLG